MKYVSEHCWTTMHANPLQIIITKAIEEQGKDSQKDCFWVCLEWGLVLILVFQDKKVEKNGKDEGKNGEGVESRHARCLKEVKMIANHVLEGKSEVRRESPR